MKKGNQCNNAKHFSCPSPFVSELIYLDAALGSSLQVQVLLNSAPGWVRVVCVWFSTSELEGSPCPGRVWQGGRGAAPSKAVLTGMEVLPSLSLAFHKGRENDSFLPSYDSFLISLFYLLFLMRLIVNAAFSDRGLGCSGQDNKHVLFLPLSSYKITFLILFPLLPVLIWNFDHTPGLSFLRNTKYNVW